MPQKTAYLTGGASGIARAVAEMLVSKGCRVAIGDRNFEGATSFVEDLNKKKAGTAIAVEVDVASWDSQLNAFKEVVKEFGRIDYCCPIAGIGERLFLKFLPDADDFMRPDLQVLDVDLTGFLYTFSLALQQMRRQEKDSDGFRGRIIAVASVCGFYCVPTLPVYTAAKHGVVGFTRSYGKYLPVENITLNSVCPNVVRTNDLSGPFYETIEKEAILTPLKGVVEAFESFLDGDISGECMEAGPNGGFTRRAPAEYLDDDSKKVLEMVGQLARPLHEPEKSLGSA